MHRGLTVADGAQMRELLREGAVFRGCSFDGADLGGPLRRGAGVPGLLPPWNQTIGLGL